MTHKDLQRLVDFNYWATDRMLQAVSAVSPEQFVEPMGSSFPSLCDTIVHIYSAEWVWYMRWQGTSPAAPVAAADYADLGALTAAWHDLEAKIRTFVDELDDERLLEVIEYRQMNGQTFRSAIWQMVQHVVNHGTYHRGQVATLLRQLGLKPASTDLIAFDRERTISA